VTEYWFSAIPFSFCNSGLLGNVCFWSTRH
jgi:hypothetical protein